MSGVRPPFTTPMPDGVPPDFAPLIDDLAPPRPQWLSHDDDRAIARWELSARLAAAVALLYTPSQDDAARRSFVVAAARSFFLDPSLMTDARVCR